MLKNRIRVLSIIFLILFIIILPIQIFNAGSIKSGSLVEVVDNEDLANPFSEASQKLLTQQEKPLEAYYLFAEQLEKDDDGFVIFPDDLAGTYIDNGVLYIFYTGNNYSHYEDLVPDDYPVEFVQKEYSYSYLSELQDEMMSTNTDFHMGYIDVVNNVVVLGTIVRENDLRSYQSSFGRFGLPIVIEAQEALSTFSELWGGDKITANSSAVTLGAPGYYNGVPAILTTFHTKGTGILAQYNYTRIGTSVLSKFGVGGDYSIVTLSNTSHNIVNKYFGPSESTSAPISISGKAVMPSVGTIIYKYGAVSGWAQLRLAKITTSVYYEIDDVTVYSVSLGNMIAGTNKPGDSGGPFFSIVGSKWYLLGILSGGNNSTAIFTPISIVDSRFTLMY